MRVMTRLGADFGERMLHPENARYPWRLCGWRQKLMKELQFVFEVRPEYK